MSLLLDALKAAENLKRPVQSGGRPATQPAAGLSGSETASLLSLAEEPIQPPLARPDAAHSIPAPPARPGGLRQNIGGVSRAPARKASTKGRTSLFAYVLAAVVALLGGAWWYLSPDTEPVALIRTTLQAPLPPAAVASPGVVTTYAIAPSAEKPHAQQIVSPTTAAAPQSRETVSPVSEPDPVVLPAVAGAARATAVVVSARPSPVLAAYAAFQAGDLARAESLYRETLAGEPQQPDAHLGLAVMAQARGDRASAASHYREVIQAIPDQPRAWSGLADLASDLELEQMESQLRGLLARRSSAALHFALGNILMRQKRWPEAQASYFSAAAAAPTNADYAFNLAVALDHLGKGQAAIQHYERAVALVVNDRAQFDVSAARQRLATLRKESP